MTAQSLRRAGTAGRLAIGGLGHGRVVLHQVSMMARKTTPAPQ